MNIIRSLSLLSLGGGLGLAVPSAWAFDLQQQLRAAQPGATIEVPAGEHHGPFVVEQSVRLIGSPGAELVGDGKGHVVAIRAPEVEISGFVIRRSGFDLSSDHAGVHVTAPGAVLRNNHIVDCLHGIYVRGADNCTITGNTIRGRSEAETIDDPVISGLRLAAGELCSEPLGQNQRGNGIHLWKSRGHVISHNDIRQTRDGIYFSFTDATQVRNNRVAQVRYGLHYMYSDDNLFEANVFFDNAAGSALMFSTGLTLRQNQFVSNRSHRAYGLLMHSVDYTRVENNVIAGNTIGVFLENNNGNTVAGNDVRTNYIGLRVSDSSSENVFTENRFIRNVHPVETSGQSLANRWTHEGRGNHWSHAYRLDLDSNGIADLPHREVDLFGAWRREFPAISLLSGSPGERLMRFIYGRAQVKGLPGIVDPAPLVAASHD